MCALEEIGQTESKNPRLLPLEFGCIPIPLDKTYFPVVHLE